MSLRSRRSPIPDGYEDLPGSTALAHVSTIGPAGSPRANPVWFHWDGEHIEFGQTKTHRKLRNRDSRIALSIVDPENPLRYLDIRGEVERVEEVPELEFITAMSEYLGKYPNHRPGDERVVGRTDNRPWSDARPGTGRGGRLRGLPRCRPPEATGGSPDSTGALVVLRAGGAFK